MKVPMEDPAAATEAFLCQSKDHWFAIRKVTLSCTSCGTEVRTCLWLKSNSGWGRRGAKRPAPWSTRLGDGLEFRGLTA